VSTALPRKEAILAALIMVLPGLLWAWVDYHPWPWDQAHYAENTLRNLAAFDEGLVAGVASMGVLMSLKPPGLTWLGMPFALLSEPALLCATLAWQAGTLVASYWSAYLISRSRLTSLAIAAFVGSTPLFIGMNHQYLAEPLQTLAVALAFLLALCVRSMSKVALFSALCVVTALAVSAKSTSLLYCGLPLLLAACALLGRQAPPPSPLLRRLRIPLVLVAIFSVALVANWYATHLPAVLEHARQSTVGEVVQNYGVQASFAAKLRFWAAAFGAALFFPGWLPAAAAAIGAGALLARRRRAVIGSGPVAAPPPVAQRAAHSLFVAGQQ